LPAGKSTGSATTAPEARASETLFGFIDRFYVKPRCHDSDSSQSRLGTADALAESA